MEFHQLKYFEATARLGSMMAAAAECHVSQPALSVQIRKLEEEAGEKLMERRPRGIFLTPAGERTLRTAKLILSESGRWREAMKGRSFGLAPALRVAAQHFISSDVLAGPIAETLAHSRGRWTLRFHERSAARIEEELRSGESDLALFDLHAARFADFTKETLLRIPYRLFCPESHPLATARRVVPEDLTEHRCLLYTHAPGLVERLRLGAVARGLDREPDYSSEHASAVFELVASGHGVAVLPASFEKRARSRRTVSRGIDDYDEEVVVTAAWPAESMPPEPARHMFDCIRKLRHSWSEAPAGGA